MNKDEFLKRDWYIQGFNATPNLISHGHTSAIKYMSNHLGYGYIFMINSFKNDFCEYYYDWEDLKSIYVKVLALIKDNPKYLEEQERYQRKLWDNGLQVAKKVRQTDLNTFSNKELFFLYQETFGWYSETASVSHLIESFVLMDEELKDNLIQYYHKSAKKEKFNTYFTKLTQPIRPSFTNDEAISLLKILKFIKERPDLLNVFLNSSNVLEKISSSIVLTILKEHRDNFHWVRCNYADGTESSLEYFVEEIRTMLKKETDPATILKEEDEKYRFNKNEKERIIKELKINDQKTLQMIRLSEQLLHFQDDRKKVILIILCSINKILYEIAKRYNLDTRLSLYLCAEEITEEIINKITNRQLQERKDGCIFLWKRTSQNKGKYDYETKVLVGKEFKDFVAILKEHDEEEINDFRGMCASTGTATGKVRICQTKDDLKKFEQGEVLITSMTRPEFVTAMKKAAAIVTDEGGITCHASIISRELKIPCVIGTKIATKVLKDGDFVEVRANHSLVKIIERVKQ